MDYGQLQQGNRNIPQAAEESRPVAMAMTRLASSIGDLETAARALAGRVKPLLPGGSPFERADKVVEGRGAEATQVPRPVRSHFTEQVDSRVWQIESITQAINEMVKGIEL